MIDDDALVEPAPGAGPLSTTTTERPLRASSNATAEPITPAPITIASVVIGASCERASASERAANNGLRGRGTQWRQAKASGISLRRRAMYSRNSSSTASSMGGAT